MGLFSRLMLVGALAPGLYSQEALSQNASHPVSFSVVPSDSPFTSSEPLEKKIATMHVLSENDPHGFFLTADAYTSPSALASLSAAERQQRAELCMRFALQERSSHYSFLFAHLAFRTDHDCLDTAIDYATGFRQRHDRRPAEQVDPEAYHNERETAASLLSLLYEGVDSAAIRGTVLAAGLEALHDESDLVFVSAIGSVHRMLAYLPPEKREAQLTALLKNGLAMDNTHRRFHYVAVVRDLYADGDKGKGERLVRDHVAALFPKKHEENERQTSLATINQALALPEPLYQFQPLRNGQPTRLEQLYTLTKTRGMRRPDVLPSDEFPEFKGRVEEELALFEKKMPTEIYAAGIFVDSLSVNPLGDNHETDYTNRKILTGKSTVANASRFLTGELTSDVLIHETSHFLSRTLSFDGALIPSHRSEEFSLLQELRVRAVLENLSHGRTLEEMNEISSPSSQPSSLERDTHFLIKMLSRQWWTTEKT